MHCNADTGCPHGKISDSGKSTNGANKTIRFPGNVVEEVEQAIQGKDCTFSSFVIAAVRAALEDLKK